MAYEKLTDLSTSIVIRLGGSDKKTGKPNPTQIEGFYLGHKEVDGKYGVTKLHVFQTPKGSEGTWGTKDMDDQLARVKLGTMTLVQFTRMVETKNNPMKKFLVSVDKKQTIEVDGSTAAETLDTSADYNDTTAEDTVDEDEAQAAALANAERRAAAARVQALVGKRK